MDEKLLLSAARYVLAGFRAQISRLDIWTWQITIFTVLLCEITPRHRTQYVSADRTKRNWTRAISGDKLQIQLYAKLSGQEFFYEAHADILAFCNACEGFSSFWDWNLKYFIIIFTRINVSLERWPTFWCTKCYILIGFSYL